MLVNHRSLSFFTLIFSILTLSVSNSDFTTLLAFKSSADLSNSLKSWSNSTQPCSGSWLGVTCNPSTHRVTRLVLNQLNLTGSIHPLTQLTHLRLLSLDHNNLSSTLNFTSWPSIKHLYLSHNHFTGIFPAGISHLSRLRRLDLSHNNLSGEIPMTELAELTHLITLRLEANSFTGTLLSLNSSSLSISDFNVSDNNLTGEIPTWLSTLPASSFAGNKNLCGRPLPYDCLNQTAVNEPEQITVSDGRRKKKMSDRTVLMIVSIDVAAALVVIGIVTCSITCWNKRRRSRRERKSEMKRYNYGLEREEDGELVCFEGCVGFDKVDELLKASAEMLGKGSLGTTYKVVMEGGDVVVVKRVRESRRRKKEIDGFLKVIGEVRHCNIVSLRAYYSSPDELLLVYDFLPNGSLHSLLHGNRGPGRTPLDWTTRLKLAAGAAQGLAFLHSSDKSKLFHGHLTSSNIIIDHLGNACITDFGLHQLLPSPSSSNEVYKAPELISNNNNNNNKQLQSGDVYSFGVILLEILTGKMATGEGETSLVKWVQRVVREEWTWEVFDFELLRYKEMEGEMMALLNVALLCLTVLQSDRPKMNMVYKMIEDIRVKGSGGHGIQSPMNDLSSASSSSSSLCQTTPNFTSS